MSRLASTIFAEPASESAGTSEDAEVDTGATTQVARWRRYGKDRLYVTSLDGTKIGWRDLVTGEDHLDAPGLESEFLAALSTWSSGAGQPAAAATDEQAVDEQRPETDAPTDTRIDATWEDLAAHRPGAMAREQALVLKQAAPVRTLLARALGVHTDERAWRVGADGEELVGAQLRRLAKKDPRWMFLHAIPVGEKGSDIDHLVVGPGGVFTLNAKHHPRANVWVRGDTFMVNGQRTRYIHNSRHEGTRASRLLTKACGFPVAVRSVVVPVGADRMTIKEPPSDVSIVNRRALAQWLRAQAPTLSEGQVLAIYDVARRADIWR